jgi:uncharacterized protein with FMN-binding domain
MRRAVLALGGTVAGLAALFSYKSHVPTVTALTTPATPGTASGTSPSMSPSGTTPTMKPPTTKPTATKSASAKATGKKTTAPATTPAHTSMTTAPASTATTKAPAPTKSATPNPPASSAPSGPSGTFSGQTVNTDYGPVQVTITVSNGKITNASDPDGGDSIGQNAIGQLDQEAVQAQSANISAVSGATYTSGGYIQSLQQAIDSAGL